MEAAMRLVRKAIRCSMRRRGHNGRDGLETALHGRLSRRGFRRWRRRMPVFFWLPAIILGGILDIAANRVGNRQSFEPPSAPEPDFTSSPSRR
jgi:hypothetical protein